MEYILKMVFLTAAGKKVTFSISGLKSTITQAQINTLMDLIIAKNIFTTSSGDFVKKSDASVVERKETKYNVE